jgi:alginate O-acetyltransferase complex protein AlgI
MLFHSFEFLFAFLPIVLILFFGISHHKFRMSLLLVSSYFFYAYWNYKFIPLLFLSTYIDFHLAKRMGEEVSQNKKKLLLLLSVSLNLGLLFVFKYLNFFIFNINTAMDFLGGPQLSLVENLVLPVGISFYTFQSMSYTIDLYRNHSRPYKSFLAFATYVSFFPQLIAGPIIRHTELVTQIQESVKKKFQHELFQQGLFLFTLGLSKKVLLADRIAMAIDPVIATISVASTLEAWLCALGYTLQLYFDFSGYSDMAIGLGLMFGLRFPPNFNSPYKAISITDFWRRWHMSLSFWLRDYLYISLGGNRFGPMRTYANLLMTMILGGLWHGAAWTYLIWGFFHGMLLAMERFLGIEKWQKKSSLMRFLWPIVTFTLVVFGWVIFRSASFEHAYLWIDQLFSWQGGFKLENFSSRTRDRFGVAMLIGLFLVFSSKNTQQIMATFKGKSWQGFLSAFLLFLSLLMLTQDSPFLYFQF